MAKHEMRDIVVLLPGITGSVLRKNGKVVWGFGATSIAKALFTGGGTLNEALALPHDDPQVDDLGDGIVADALMPDLHLLPGIWKIDGYGKIAEAIRSTFEVTEGKNFFQFPYDWRRDNRVAARKLARLAHGWLAQWRQSSGNANARLILIGHSMGGLVSRYYLECLDGWSSTKALVTFGTPYRGSLNALDGLANGLKKGPMNLTPVARQLTALYQLLPVYPCYDDGDGQLRRVAEVSGIPNVDQQKAQEALAFHREIEQAVELNRQRREYQDGGYRIFPVVGVAQVTNLSGRRSGSGVEILQTYEGKAHGGDGTVPRVSATPIELQNETGAMYAATKHGSLQNAEAVIAHLTGLLTGLDLDLGAFRKNIRVSLEVPDVIFSNEPLVVRAAPNHEDAELVATLWRGGERQPVASSPMPATSEWRSVSFPPQPEGNYRVTITGTDVETAEDSILVADSLLAVP